MDSPEAAKPSSVVLSARLLWGALALAGAALQVWGLVLLFTSPGKSWLQKQAAG